MLLQRPRLKTVVAVIEKLRWRLGSDERCASVCTTGKGKISRWMWLATAVPVGVGAGWDGEGMVTG